MTRPPLSWAPGTPWGISEPYVPILVNPINRGRLTTGQVEAAVTEAMLRWQAATNDGFTFDVWVGVDPSMFVAARRFDGVTTVHFSSRTEATQRLGAGRAGTTDIWFDPDTGQIIEADIEINDLDLSWTTDPLLATYDAEGQLGKILVLADVLTHELGHVLGLGHSAVQDATMFPGAWNDQATLACDDQLAVSELYSSSAPAGITGTVSVDGTGPAAGVHVVAVSTSTRRPILGAFTTADGRFEIIGLPADDYVLLAEPWPEDASSLPATVAPAAGLCGGLGLARAPLADGSALVQVTVPTTGTVALDPWTLSCGDGIDASDSPLGATVDAPRPLTQDAQGQIAHVERITAGPSGTWYALDDFAGDLSIDFVTYSLFSPGRIDAELTTVDGAPIDSAVLHPLSESNDYSVWDTRLEATGLEAGDYRLYLEASRLPGNLYPGGEAWLDADTFFVALGGANTALQTGGPCPVDVPGTYVGPPLGLPRTRATAPGLSDSPGCGCTPTRSRPASTWAAAIAALSRRR